MSEFKAITTQEEFDAAIGERLKRERASAAEKYADYETLKAQNASYAQQLEASKKQSDDLNNELATAKNQVKAFELSSLKQRIAHEVGIPYELAGRLSGEDEKAIRQDAESISGLLKPSTPLQPLKSTEPKGTKDSAYKALLDSLKGD